MKAILVFDVDNIDIENTQATYIELQCNDITIQMALVNHWLKPMPKKKSVFCNKGVGKKTHYEESKYVIGFNDCIDEILGEQNE